MDPTLANTVNESPNSPTISPSYLARDNIFSLPTLLVANVRSIINKIDDHELESVAEINQVDVICITESWLNTSIADSMISLSNFIQFRKDRTYSCVSSVMLTPSFPCTLMVSLSSQGILTLLVHYLMKNRLKRLAGLTQMIKVPTRHNAILDWCLTNAKKVVFDVRLVSSYWLERPQCHSNKIPRRSPREAE